MELYFSALPHGLHSDSFTLRFDLCVYLLRCLTLGLHYILDLVLNFIYTLYLNACCFELSAFIQKLPYHTSKILK